MEYKTCSKCNIEYPKSEEYFEVRKSGSKDGFRKQCRICRNTVKQRGLKKLLEVNNEVYKYLVDKEDGIRYSYSSNKKIKVHCPLCGYSKEMTVNDLYSHGFGCNMCADGISFGEKVISNILDQVGYKNKYKREKKFDWAKDKRYDFYIPSLNTVIEVHGMQHYKETKIGRQTGRTFTEEKENDKLKKKLALDNRIKHYIVIDCRYSRIDYIQKNVINNLEFNKIFDVNKIDWKLVLEYVNTNYIEKSANLHNKGYSLNKIANELSVNRCTIRDWLKLGAFIGICDYNEEKNRKYEYSKEGKIIPKYNTKKILEMYLEFNNIQEVAKRLNCHEDTVRKTIKEKAQNGECIYEPKQNQISCRCRKVVNRQSGEIYESITKASQKNSIPMTTLRRYCNSKNNIIWDFV